MTTFIEMAVYLNSNIAPLNILVNFQGINHCDRAYFSNILEPFSMDVFFGSLQILLFLTFFSRSKFQKFWLCPEGLNFCELFRNFYGISRLQVIILWVEARRDKKAIILKPSLTIWTFTQCVNKVSFIKYDLGLFTLQQYDFLMKSYFWSTIWACRVFG